METKAYFTDIQQQLIRQIESAGQSIYIAMAWFTDKKLIHSVHQRAKKGVKVYLLLSDDDINRERRDEFDLLEAHGAQITWVTVNAGDNIMHNKFCVIDERTVITGSYNWTNRAHSNHENITVLSGDEQLADDFISEFERLLRLYNKTAAGLRPFDYGAVSKRLKIIKNLLDLQELDEVSIQVSRLKQMELIPEVAAILDLLEQERYSEAIAEMHTLQSRFSALTSTHQQRLSELRMQIRYLEIEYLSAVEHRDLLDRTIADIRLKLRLKLGQLILELLNLRIEWSKQRQKYHKANKFQDLVDQLHQHEEDLKRDQQAEAIALQPEDELAIRELYKKGVKMCHPDLVSEEKKAQAEKIFVQLKDAFDRNDIHEVRHIVTMLESNIWDLGSGNTRVSEIDKLEAIALELRYKIESIRKEIDQLTDSEDYKLFQQCGDMDTYLQQQEIELKNQILQLRNKLAANQQ